MSYCRFAWDGSDVYVYESESGIECCGCHLDEFFTADCRCEKETDPCHREAALMMVRHLRRHRAVGHVVPLYASAALSEEAGVWTWERALFALRWRLDRLIGRTVCRRFGHRGVPNLSPDLPHMRCARCRRGDGYRHEDGSVRWFGEEE